MTVEKTENKELNNFTDAKRAYLALMSTAVKRDLASKEIEKLNQFTIGDETSGYERLLGVVFTALGPGHLTMELAVDQRHLQPWGLANGGVYASLGETAGSVAGYLAAGGTAQVVGVNNNTDFFRSAKAGTTIVAQASPVHVGRTTQVWQIVHTRKDDAKLLARTTLRLQVLENKGQK